MSPPPASVSPAVRLAELDRLAPGLLNAATEEALLGTAGAVFHQAFDVDWVSVALRSTDGRRYRLLPLDRGGRPPGSGTDLPADLLAASRVMERGPLLHEADLRRSNHPDLAGLADSGLVSAVVLALEANGQPIGALTLARSEGADFDESDVLILLHAGSLLATAIRHRRAVDEAEQAAMERDKVSLILDRRAAELRALQRMTSAVDSGDARQAVQVVVDEITSLRGIEVCRISAVDGAGLTVVAEAAHHGAAFQDRVDPAGSGSPDALVVASRRPVLWRRPSPGDQDEIAALLRLGVTSVFALPIVLAGEPIGALAAGSTGGHRFVTDEHIVTADVVCRQLAVAVGGADGLLAARATDQPTLVG